MAHYSYGPQRLDTLEDDADLSFDRRSGYSRPTYMISSLIRNQTPSRLVAEYTIRSSGSFSEPERG